jgi:hypothetical protein
MLATSIPKPSFHSCDETSLKLQWDAKPFQSISSEQFVIKLQYKEVHEKWEQCKEYVIPGSSVSHVNLTEADVADLKPGTPYYVRIAVQNQSSGEVTIGPETVFDTKSIDCTPKGKGKKCVIC